MTRPTCRASVGSIVPPVMGLLLTVPVLAVLAAGPEKPRKTAVVEKAEVRLILLDVEARDKHGRPLAGLRQADFRLKLGTKRWPIVSVDDLCGCREEQARGAVPSDGVPPGAVGPASASGSLPTTAASSAPVERPLFVMYLDFSQLQLDGRARALNEAIRWVRHGKAPDDEVMIMGYAVPGGLRELCPRTRDASHLEAALAAAKADRSLVDTFANGFFDRIEECNECVRRCYCLGCVECCPCLLNALQEHSQGRRSLRALKTFMVHLDGVPGRKVVLYFHENGVIFPGSFYPLEDPTFEVGTHETLLNQLGAEATTSRAAIYSIQTGDSNLFNPLASAAVNLGAELADYTGGAYNRAPADIFATLDRATHGCSCIYRIGFEPPETSRTQVYQAKIAVNGVPGERHYRVLFLTEEDRLARSVRSVMALPEAATDIPLAAAIEPVAAKGGTWDLAVRLALDVEALSLLPAAGAETGQVDVGALLHRKNSSDSWEMLTGSTVHGRTSAATGVALLYERIFHGLAPGEYYLTAFARDPLIDLAGGASATLTLPAPGQAGLIGPFAVSPGRRVYRASLPLRNESASRPAQQAAPGPGAIPALRTGIQAGALLEVTTWLCPAEQRPVGDEELARFVAREGVPAFRLPPARIAPAGRCTRVTDEIATAGLSPGRYTYHIEWRKGDQGPARTGELSFEIRGASIDAAPGPEGRK